MSNQALTVIDNRFGGNKVLNVEVNYYTNRLPRIDLVETDGMPYCTASIGVPCSSPPKDCVFIKDYSENRGVVDMFVKAGLIHPEVMETTYSGYVAINAYRMTEKLLAKFADHG